MLWGWWTERLAPELQNFHGSMRRGKTKLRARPLGINTVHHIPIAPARSWDRQERDARRRAPGYTNGIRE